MSDEQSLGLDKTTSGPPRSYGRAENTSIISSSQLSPKSPAPSRRESRIERSSWGEPGTERIDAKRRSTVTFGGKTSVAPSDSISKMNSKPGQTRTRRSVNYDGEGTQYSRRRSAPWQDHDYRSTFPSKAGSSRGGTAWSGDRAPLTENNLEEFNEKTPPKSEPVSQRDIERQVLFEEIDRKSKAKSRRDSGIATQEPQSRAGWIGADDRRMSKTYSRVERDDGEGDRTLVTTRRKTEVDDDDDDWEDEEIETKSKSKSRYDNRGGRTTVTTRRKTEVDEYDDPDEEFETKSKSKSKSRYETYSRRPQSSISKASTRRQSRAAGVYEQAQEKRYSNSSAGRQSYRARTAIRPPTMPPEDNDNTRSREVATVAAGAAAGEAVATNVGSRPDGRSKAPTQFFEEEQTRQTEAKSERYSSRRTEAQTRRTEVQRGVETERQSNVSRTRAPSQPAATGALTRTGRATSPSSSPSSPTTAQSPTSPEDCQWERRVHIVETRKPDGRLVWDREVSTRRIYPQQTPAIAA